MRLVNYSINDITDKKAKKAYLNEFKELIDTLKIIGKGKQQIEGSIHQKLIEVGVISKREEFETVLDLVDKEFQYFL